MITEDYVSFETAKLLKEKGFDENTTCKYAGKKGATEEWYDDYRERMVRFNLDEGYLIEPLTEPQDTYCVYGDTIPAPTLQMAMKWLREEKGVQIEVTIVGMDPWESPTKWMYGYRCQTKDVIDRRNVDFSSYEQAAESAIKYCLENLI